MIEPITKKVSDESEGNTYRFTFYCDLCGRPWRSVPYAGNGDPDDKESDHDAAFARAALEARDHFNRCPVCQREVCDECFRILPERDMCKECAAARENEDQQRSAAEPEIFKRQERQETPRKMTGLVWFRRIFALHNTGPPRKRR